MPIVNLCELCRSLAIIWKRLDVINCHFVSYMCGGGRARINVLTF